VFILLYYVLSSIRLYLCFVLCENIYIYNYIFIYLFIDLFHLFVFFYLFTCCIVLFFIYYICIYIEREREIIYHFRDQTLPPPAWLQVAAASDWALRSLLWATPRQLSETQQRGLRMGKRQWKVELSVEGLVSYKK
jgi:hypothetical protein